MKQGAIAVAALLLAACGSGEGAVSCPTSDGPHWQKLTMPKTLEVFESGFIEDRVGYGGGQLWFWTGKSAVTWDLVTDEWEEIPGFDGVELYDDPFVRLIAGRLVVWGDKNADDRVGANPPGRLEGFVYHGDTGWRPAAQAPSELKTWFLGAATDASRLFVFTSDWGMPVQVGIYDVLGDTWTHLTTPFLDEDVAFLTGYSWHRWAVTQEMLVIADQNNGVWILDPVTLSWTHLEDVVSSGELRYLTATSDRVFAWSNTGEAAEILLDEFAVRPLELPEWLYGLPQEAGDWVVFERADPYLSREPVGWNIYDSVNDRFSRVGVDCEVALSITPEANLIAMTDFGLFVSGALDWGDGPTYERGTYPREGRLLVLPDSKPLPP